MSMSKLKISNLVGAKLKELRLAQGYKIHDMATKLNKTDQQLFRYERCINKIDLDTIVNYLEVLNVDISTFFLNLYSDIEKLKVSNDNLIYLSEQKKIKGINFLLP